MKLTKREREVHLALVRSGARNKDLAKELGISEATIRSHVSHLLSKLGCETRTQLALAPLQ